MSGFEPSLSYFLAVSLWASDLLSPSVSFLTDKMDNNGIHLIALFWGFDKLMPVKCLQQQQLHKWVRSMLAISFVIEEQMLGEGRGVGGQERKP